MATVPKIEDSGVVATVPEVLASLSDKTRRESPERVAQFGARPRIWESVRELRDRHVRGKERTAMTDVVSLSRRDRASRTGEDRTPEHSEMGFVAGV